MPEHTIPETLIEQIKAGRAALVVGAGIGDASWKHLLERMTRELETRGRDGDDAAAKDLARLLHKGSLVRAVGFLARALGEDACDRLVEEAWQTPEALPEVAKLLARIPIRHVWTTFPGDVLERALEEHSPEGWPATKVVTYQDLGELSRRRRTLIKMLGNFDSYVVTPRSVRRALSGAVDLREYARDFYVEGTLIFVGFRYGDPDLAALLDRVFGLFEPPRSSHYFLGAGVGPVTVDELLAEHHIEVVNLAGKSGDEIAEKAVVEWLEALTVACGDAHVTLHQAVPDADDLDGWMALLADGQKDAADAVDLIERRAREANDTDRLVEVLLGRIEHSDEAAERAGLLRELADVYENGAGDLKRAFEALTTAMHVDPSDNAIAAAAERLAAATGSWADLVAEASELTTEGGDPKVQSRWWGRLGRWYSEKLDRHDYALPSLRRALELDGENQAAHAAFAEVLRKQSKWAELADAIRAHVEVETDTATQLDLYIALGDLCESHLASTAKAIEAYQAAVDLDDDNDDALAALERLYRRDERWGLLAKVLERRAEIIEAAGDAGRAGAIRRELATLRHEKLGDLEGAISRYETQLDADPADLAALKALEDLYDKTGRTDDYLRTLERLSTYAPEGEKLANLRKLAAELEDREGARDRAIDAYQRILDIDGVAEDAFRGLGRLLAADGKWYDVVTLKERQVAAAKSPAQKIELFLETAGIHEKELADPHRAIECHLNVLALDETNRSSLHALARLYQRVEAWDRAVAILVRHADLEGNRGAALWAEAGRFAYEHLDDAELAERHLEKALAIEPGHLVALRTAARLHQSRSAWAKAVDCLLRAEEASSSRIERVEILGEAAELVETRLEDGPRALELREKILKLDPDHVEAGEQVADRLVADHRWDDALPILEMLARRAEGADRLERARREAQLGKAYEELHRHEKAAKHYRVAVEADADNLDAALGLAAMLMAEATGATDPAAVEDKYKEVDKRYREVLARHRTGLADGQVADIWHRLGETARALGDDKKAENALRRALERDPGHEPALQALIDVAGARGDWKTVVEAKRSLIEAVPDAVKGRLYDEIGDVWRHKLKDAGSAVGAYLEALRLQPGSHVLLHKLLDAYTEQKQWRRAIETLDQLAAQESGASRRAKYYYAAAVIARDELADAELAVEKFHAALDDVPETPKAFEAIDKLLTDKHDWKNLARAYRRHLKRLGEDADHDRLLEMWTRLGDVCLDHLGDHEAAIAAFEVASGLDPDDVGRHEQLADLYLEAGEPRRADAIEELQVLLAHAPDRVELYKALSNLYREEHELDKSWCVAQALVFLGAATDDERRLYEKHRPQQFTPVARRLTEELWQKAIIHPREDRIVGAIFASTLGGLVASSAQPPQAFGLDAGQRADLDHDQRPVSRVVKYATGVLALDPTPMVWLQKDGDGLRVANTTDKGRLQPSLLVGEPQLDKVDERELAFEVGKRLAYLRPERFVTFALGSLPKLEAAFQGALLAAGAALEGAAGAVTPGDEARRLAQGLKTTVPGAMLEQVAALATKVAGRIGNGLIPGWRSATDMTANRVGLILCNDLEVAARLIATEVGITSTLPAKDRLRDLLAYSVSDGYFNVRRHLGVHVRDEVSA
ncbi:MAG: tetratricopeptide repeat protein [Kofleriaceae bacterium]|nr:tetratricopeptide repeat protein [Myxococcales bacterium]MCB9565241.1 tetratricopeptide repeat protein [Kofleriaceae bacterium]MCB9572396.1 tetratricopeptide repeat protein [Kofleriaceae bacterium]